MTESDIRELKRKAIEIRRLTVEQIAHIGIGHLGGSLSVVEILTYLYHRVLQVDPTDPKDARRDKFVMSKGHAGPALYSVLADKGFFPREWLETLNRGGTNLPSHCDMNRTPGIDMTTGSLGQGLSAAVGIAIGHRIRELPGRVFALLSDGDINEGQTWEAAMSAAMFGLDRLVAFIDYNQMQIDGTADEVMRTDRQVERWTAFGWFAQEADGHDFGAIDEAARAAIAEPDRPSIVVLHTLKGKGVPFCEGDYRNHNMPVSEEQAQEAFAALRAQEEVLG